MKRARKAHYLFAHVVLRMVATQNPIAMLGILGSPDRDDFLNTLIETVNDMCGEDGRPPADFTVDDIAIHPHRVNGFPCAIVEMPQPIGITECYYVAIIVKITQEQIAAGSVPEDVEIDYFTLEYGADRDATEYAVLCRWADTTHLNMGEGPPPTVEGFINAIESRR